MQPKHKLQLVVVVLALIAVDGMASIVNADQNQPQSVPSARVERSGEYRLGIEGFGSAGISWPAAKESFEAAGLDAKPFEFGGGARVTGIWRHAFAQVALTRWSDTGERTFIDSAGTRFPLGIPLNVKATYLDVSAGWKAVIRNAKGNITAWPYIGAGAGLVRYSEVSPFAEPGDDANMESPSYHVLMGVEVPLLSWLAAAVDGRYRYVPDVLGEGGSSAALGEDVLGGVQATVGLRVGFGGSPRHRLPSRPARAPEAEPEREFRNPSAQSQRSTAVIVAPAPVFLRPDPKRAPLRTLQPGTAVNILEEAGDWVQVQFNDPQYGVRVGYVERRFVEVRK